MKRCTPVTTDEGVICEQHGSKWLRGQDCLTRMVLNDVADHRAFQYGEYGPNRDVLDGTGPDVEWLAPVIDAARSAYTGPFTAKDIEDLFREEWDYDRDPDPAERTWMRMVREEIAEVFKESDPDRIEEELIQAAALLVSWAEKIRERRS